MTLCVWEEERTRSIVVRFVNKTMILTHFKAVELKIGDGASPFSSNLP